MMRMVKVYKRVWDQGARTNKLVEDGGAWFHQFGIDHEEFESDPGMFTTAIIERNDGVVQSVPVDCIKFTEPMPL